MQAAASRNTAKVVAEENLKIDAIDSSKADVTVIVNGTGKVITVIPR